MNKTKILLFSFLMVGGLFAFSGAQAATRDVCKSGCAYSTIQSAVNAAAAGDVIEIRDSQTYTENITVDSKSGTSLARYTIRSASGQTPVIAGWFNLSSSQYWTLEGLSVQSDGVGNRDGNIVIRSYWANNLIIDSCVLDGLDVADHIIGGYVDKIEVKNSVLRNGNPSGSYGVETSDASYNSFHHNEVHHVEIGISIKRDNDDAIYNNYIHDIYSGYSSWAIYMRDSQRAKVYNNVINTANEGIELFSHGTEPSEFHEIYNNTFFNAKVWGIRFYGGSNDIVIKNNIFHSCGTGITFSGANLTYGNNSFFNNTTNVNLTSGGIDVGGNITTNPNLVFSGNKPDPYFALSQNSPAGDAGIDDDPDIPDIDYLGNPRNGSQWIGALEYISGEIDVAAPTAPSGLSVW